MRKSPWSFLIYGSRRTIWLLNLWNRFKLKFWPLFDLSLIFTSWRKGRKGQTITKKSQWTLLIIGSIRRIWDLNLNLWNRLKLKIGTGFDLFWQWTLLISGLRQTIWHLNLCNRLKLKFGPMFDLSLTFEPWR